MRLVSLIIRWHCNECDERGAIQVGGGTGWTWAEAIERIAATHKAVSPACEFDLARMTVDFEQAEGKE